MSAALYIQVPFCRHKCIYCDFYSITQQNRIVEYAPTLHKEIDLWANDTFFANVQFSTVYFGGGTPSLLSPTIIHGILKKLFSSFKFTSTVEITMEVNPGALLMKYLKGYKAAGVNRLSIGVQSFSDNDLQFLTRIHSAQHAQDAVLGARRAGFANIGIDLIFGLPGQSPESWRRNMRQAVHVQPEHISIYGLTFEQHTPLWSMLKTGEVQQCDDAVERDMFINAIDLLRDAGYEQYEISNFAVSGFRSRHNQKYWDSSPFLSFGPSAHSFDGQRRWWNHADFLMWRQDIKESKRPLAGEEKLGILQRAEEGVLLGLRRKTGVALSHLCHLIGVPDIDFLSRLQAMVGGIDSVMGFEKSAQDYLLTTWNNHLCLTKQGILLCNNITENIFKLVNIAFRGAALRSEKQF